MAIKCTVMVLMHVKDIPEDSSNKNNNDLQVCQPMLDQD